MPITGKDIARSLDEQNDFDLELCVHRSLTASGFVSEHAGIYSDPVTRKPRQFDVRARRFFPSVRWQVLLAVQCKSLSADFPAVVSRVPRPAQESYHEVIRSWERQDTGEDFVEALRRERGLELYLENGLVGKKVAQIRRDPSAASGFKSADDEPYDKWSQALESAVDLVREAVLAHRGHGTTECYTLVLPVLVVSDETLWVVDYTESGRRAQSALPVQEAEIYLDREYEVLPGRSYHISHLHLFTRSGFTSFVSRLSQPGERLLERMFEFTTLRDPSRPGRP
jgi:hypothetical protein